jgi:hypothetical protein
MRLWEYISGNSGGAKMLPVTPIKVAAQRRLQNSVRAYLEGKKNLLWVAGIVRGSEKETAMLLLTRFSRYNGTPRYRELQVSLRHSERG